MPKDAEKYLLSCGLVNALYFIKASILTEELFGTLIPCPIQGCETMETEAMKQQSFPFYNELKVIFAARMQRIRWNLMCSVSHVLLFFRRFLNYEDPLINHYPWTAMEDKNLLHIVQQRGLSNWIDIAVLLGTNRTYFQCLARYQRSFNASILKREWTKEEDDQFRDAVETFGESTW